MKHKTLNADQQINGSADFSADEGSCVLLCALNLIPSGRITSEFPYHRGFWIKFENFLLGGGGAQGPRWEWFLWRKKAQIEKISCFCPLKRTRGWVLNLSCGTPALYFNPISTISLPTALSCNNTFSKPITSFLIFDIKRGLTPRTKRRSCSTDNWNIFAHFITE